MQIQEWNIKNLKKHKSLKKWKTNKKISINKFSKISKKYWEKIMSKQFNLFSNSYKKEKKNHVLSIILKLDKVKIFKEENMEKK